MRAAFAALWLAGCWDWSQFEGDASIADSGSDAGTIDAGTIDAGTIDAGVIDAGMIDAGDCGPCPCASDVCIASECAPAARTVSIGSGHHFVCAALDDGTVHCIGDNEYGQLGVGSTSPGSASWVMATSSGFDQLGSGGDVHLALLSSGAASYWGIRPGSSVAGTPMTSATSLSGTFDRIASGGEFVCGIAGGALSCLGDNSSGQLGVGDTSYRGSFTSVAGTWDDVSAGLSHTCGIQLVSGQRQLFCWGSNDRGQLGVGSATDHDAPQRVGIATDWDQVSAGKDFVCAVRTGRVYCWGNNDSEQLGGMDVVMTNAPGAAVRAGGSEITDAVRVEAGRFTACALRADGSAWCWGSNDCGALGDGSFSVSRPDPVLVQTAGVSGERWEQIEVGHHVACATRDDGALYCWGRTGLLLMEENTSCGISPDPPSPSPTRVCF